MKENGNNTDSIEHKFLKMLGECSEELLSKCRVISQRNNGANFRLHGTPNTSVGGEAVYNVPPVDSIRRVLIGKEPLSEELLNGMVAVMRAKGWKGEKTWRREWCERFAEAAADYMLVVEIGKESLPPAAEGERKEKNERWLLPLSPNPWEDLGLAMREVRRSRWIDANDIYLPQEQSAALRERIKQSGFSRGEGLGVDMLQLEDIMRVEAEDRALSGLIIQRLVFAAERGYVLVNKQQFDVWADILRLEEGEVGELGKLESLFKKAQAFAGPENSKVSMAIERFLEEKGWSAREIFDHSNFSAEILVLKGFITTDYVSTVDRMAKKLGLDKERSDELLSLAKTEFVEKFGEEASKRFYQERGLANKAKEFFNSLKKSYQVQNLPCLFDELAGLVESSDKARVLDFGQQYHRRGIHRSTDNKEKFWQLGQDVIQNLLYLAVTYPQLELGGFSREVANEWQDLLISDIRARFDSEPPGELIDYSTFDISRSVGVTVTGPTSATKSRPVSGKKY